MQLKSRERICKQNECDRNSKGINYDIQATSPMCQAQDCSGSGSRIWADAGTVGSDSSTDGPNVPISNMVNTTKPKKSIISTVQYLHYISTADKDTVQNCK